MLEGGSVAVTRVTVRSDCYPFQRQGSRSSTLVILWSGMRAKVSASQAWGSTALRLAVSIKVGDGSCLTACFRTDEEVILPPEGDGAHAAFGGVVVEFQDAMAEVGAQAVHGGQHIADGSREWGFARDRGELHGQPSLQIVEDRGRVAASQLSAAIR